MSGEVSLLTVGSEILDGRIFDTNAGHLAGCCTELGLRVARIATCDDVITETVAALRYCLAAAPVVIVTGGLGPTEDDLTRESVAVLAGVTLERDEAVLLALQERYRARKRVFDPSNAKQALFPAGAEVVPNHGGTAAGFHVTLAAGGPDGRRAHVIALPGVPWEAKRMIDEWVLPFLHREFAAARPLARRGLRIFGLPEAAVGTRVREAALSKDVVVAYRTMFPEIQVIVSGSDSALVTEMSAKAESAIGVEHVVARDLTTDLPALIHGHLTAAGKTLAIAESCTAGLISSLLASHPGASRYLVGGVVSYANSVKQEQLGVSAATLAAHGAVSAETAREMAEGARRSLKTDLGLAVTGIAGPDGGSPEKPVGTIHDALATAAGTVAAHRLFVSPRDMVRRYAAFAALDLLRRDLLGLPLSSDPARF